MTIGTCLTFHLQFRQCIHCLCNENVKLNHFVCVSILFLQKNIQISCLQIQFDTYNKFNRLLTFCDSIVVWFSQCDHAICHFSYNIQPNKYVHTAQPTHRHVAGTQQKDAKPIHLKNSIIKSRVC